MTLLLVCYRAKTALTKASEEVESSLVLEKDPLVLKFGGIGNFSTKVVYGKIEEGSSKKRLSSMTGYIAALCAHLCNYLSSIFFFCRDCTRCV